MIKTMKVLFYVGIMVLVFVIGHMIYLQFSWLPPTIVLVFMALGWIIPRVRGLFNEWIQKWRQWLNKELLDSLRKLIPINVFLFLLIVAVVDVDRRLLLETQSRIDIATYQETLNALNSDHVEVRSEAARVISQIFLRYEEPSDILPGLLKICEDPNPQVRYYRKEPLESSRFKNETLALELEALIFKRLLILRQMYCRPSSVYRSPPKELVNLGDRAVELLLTFETISQFIKSPEYKLNENKLCHEVVYDSLDILALLISISTNPPGHNFSLEELFRIIVMAKHIKRLLRSAPFDERYKFITDPNNPYAPTWYLTVKFRISQFIAKEKVGQIFKQVLAEP